MAGRRETLLDPDAPEHLVVFARQLRELRAACGAPAYRRLSTIAHCAAGSLSEAAGGRRLPTWELTRGYVTGCLRHAAREDDLPGELERWRVRWEAALAVDRTPGPCPPRQPPPTAVPIIARPRRRFALLPALLAAVVLATLLTGSAPRGPEPMTGLFNVLLLPASRTGDAAGWAERITTALDAQLRTWPARDPAIQVRGPDRVGDTGDAVARAAAEHGADVAVRPRFSMTGSTMTVTVELAVMGRTLGAAPEFVGAHQIRLSESMDAVRTNLRAAETVTERTMRYLQGVVAFVRGLGDYARGDVSAAEARFHTADRELAAVQGERREVVLVMLGQAVGRTNPVRAAAFFKQAVEVNPGYQRARVDLADTLRSGCDPGTPDRGAPERLRRAIAEYEAGLGGDPVLTMRSHLGRGLARQCLNRDDPTAADDFTEVMRLFQRLPRAAGTTEVRRVAADARAALARQDLAAGLAADAAAGYEEALVLHAGFDPDRRGYLLKRQAMLDDLLIAYRRLDRPQDVSLTEQRLSDTKWRLCFLKSDEAARAKATG